jgi:hypothetical protein
MTAATGRQERVLELTREELWVAHHVLLDRLELEAQAPTATDSPPLAIRRAFEKLDVGRYQLTRREHRYLRDELRQYAAAEETPTRDRPIAQRILEKLEWSTNTISTANSSI